MRFKRKRIMIMIIITLIFILLTFNINTILKSPLEVEISEINLEKQKGSWLNSLNLFKEKKLYQNLNKANQRRTYLARNVKLLTIFTTFIPVENKSNDKFTIQMNFLNIYKIPSIVENSNLIIYTNNSFWWQFIKRNYPNIVIQPEFFKRDFKTPFIKELYLKSMQISDTFFYMFTNSDILFTHDLITSLTYIRKLWYQSTLRSNIIIIGTRVNVIFDETGQESVEKLSETGIPFILSAEDYFIMTRDTLDWFTFYEFIVGRTAYDNCIVDYAFHNELELIDVSVTVTAVHQSDLSGNFVSHQSDISDNLWNSNICRNNVQHGSITCARYITFNSEIKSSEIVLFDKKEKQFKTILPRKLQNFVLKTNQKFAPESFNPNAKLTIIVLAYAKPISLRNLLESLKNAEYFGHQIDLWISLDRTPNKLFDLECLKVAQEFQWEFGNKFLKLHENHIGSLEQWLGEWWLQLAGQTTRVLILEDTVQLSQLFYKWLLNAYQMYLYRKNILGLTLDRPIGELKDYNPAIEHMKLSKEFTDNAILYKIPSTKSFAPFMANWNEFVNWYNNHKNRQSVDLTKTRWFLANNRGSYTKGYLFVFQNWLSFYLELSYRGFTKYILYYYNNKGLALLVDYEFTINMEEMAGNVIRTLYERCYQQGKWVTNGHLINTTTYEFQIPLYPNAYNVYAMPISLNNNNNNNNI